ncbi:MAG TPA: GAF domain-containing protein, partial [Stellaceae bacterium]|nr:GAF domain-containing protein [Stellaceae bacterium]
MRSARPARPAAAIPANSLETIAELRRELAQARAERDEALAQQAATTEVLQVINSSPGDLVPVFEAMLAKVRRLSGAFQGALRTFDGEAFHLAAADGEPDQIARLRELGPIQLGDARSGGPFALIARGERVVHIADLRETEAYRNDPVARERIDARGSRTWLTVALRKEETLLGVINVTRREVRPFSEREIALVRNFAAQAVIAMENARLITETREALEQQTATAEVLGIINSSPGDLTPVFDAILEKALSLCSADFGCMWLRDGDVIRAGAIRGAGEEFTNFLLRERVPVDSEMAVARAVRERFVIHQDDIRNGEYYRRGYPLAVFSADKAGIRSILMVPLSKEETGLGLLTIYRREIKPFTEKEIALVENFAAQAVIAMENARLITETREALEQQTATAEVLGVINSSPGDLAPVFDAMLEKAMHLCGATFGYMTDEI